MSALIKLRLAIFILIGLTFAACGGQPIPPTPAVIIVTATPAPSVATPTPAPRRTLPPTWTPEPSITPRPTSTPQPTITITATFSAQVVCQNFTILSAPADNAQLDYDGTATFTWQGVPDGATVMLTVLLHGTNKGLNLSLPVSGDSMLPVPFARLPDQDGQYDWMLWIKHPLYGDICQHSGSFVRSPAVFM